MLGRRGRSHRARLVISALSLLVAAGCGGEEDPCASDSPPASCTRKPVVTIVSPRTNATIFDIATLEATVEDQARITQVQAFGGATSLGIMNEAPYRLTFDTTTLADGPLLLRVEATNANNQVGTAQVTVVVDNGSPPTVTLNSPDPARAYGGTVWLRATASDGAGITSVRFSVDGTLIQEVTSTPFEASFDSRTLSDGTHQVEAAARDGSGLTTRANGSFTVDNTGPEVTFDPLANSTVSGPTNVTVSATDPAGVILISSLGMSSMMSPLAFMHDFGLEVPGPFVLTATVADGAIIDDLPGVGNRTVGSLPLTVGPSGNAPQITVQSPAAGAIHGGSMSVAFSVSGGAPISMVTATVDGTAITVSAGPAYTASVDTRTLGDGAHELLIDAQDSAGIHGTARVTFSADNTPPQITMNPPDGAAVSGEVSLSVAATDVSGIRSITSQGQTATVSPLLVQVDTTTVVTGPFAVVAVAADQAIVDGQPTGNIATARSVWDALNAGGPALSLIAPANPVGFFGGRVTVQVDAQDADGVSEVVFSLDGAQLVRLTAPPYRTQIDTAPLSNGAHRVLARARDGQGNPSALSLNLQVDNAAPVVTFDPPAGTNLTGVITVTVNAADGAGIRSITSNGNTGSSSPLTFSLDTNLLRAGPFTLTATAIDAAVINDVAVSGNRGVGSVSWTVDNPSPTVTFVAPANLTAWYGGDVTLEANAQDSGGVSSVAFLVDGVEIGRVTTPPYRRTLNTRPLSEGAHAVQAVARDAAGNTGTAEISLQVDNAAPVVRFDSPPAPGATIGGSVSITVNGIDSSGVSSMTCEGNNATTSPLRFTLNTTTLPNGPYTIQASAIDRSIVSGGSGNSGSGSLAVNIFNAQNAAPVVTFVTPQNGDGVYRSANIQVTATAPPGIRRVDFYINNVLVNADTRTPYAFDANLEGRTGPLTITASATSLTGVVGYTRINVTSVNLPRLRRAEIYEAGAVLANTNYAVGDIDGDGRQDLLAGGQSMSYLLRRPSGVFGAPVIIPGNSGDMVRLADYNGDGTIDIIARNGPGVDAYSNLGGSTFAPPNSVQLGAGLFALAVGDLDNDGDIDVVAGQGGTSAPDVYILRQNALHDFVNEAQVGQVGRVSDIVLADVDNDNDLDVVLGRNSGTSPVVTVYRNDGSGAFPAGLDTQAAAPPERMAVGDLDGDGRLDIVATVPNMPNALLCLSRRGIQVMIGAGTGQFTTRPPICLPEAPSGVALGDLDRDGDLDVVATSGGIHGARVWLNDGDANLAMDGRYLVASGAQWPTLVDIDGDGAVELLASSNAQNAIAVVENMGGGQLYAMPSFELRGPSSALAIAELAAGSGTNLPDVVVAQDRVGANYAALRIYRNDGDAFSLVRSASLAADIGVPTSVSVGNLNGTGALDIAVGSLDDTAQVYFDALTGTSPTVTLVRPYGVAIGRVLTAGTGQLVVTQDDAADTVHVFDSSLAQITQMPVGTTPRGVLLANLDADPQGRLDIAVANAGSSNVTLYRSNGTGFELGETYNALSAVTGLAVGRVNTDTVNDLVAVGTRVTLLIGDPSFVRFQSPTGWDAETTTPSRIVTVDLNRDGRDDVVVLNPSVDRASILIARPQGGFFDPEAIPIGDQAGDLAVADLDGNGRVDVVSINRIIPAFSALYNFP